MAGGGLFEDHLCSCSLFSIEVVELDTRVRFRGQLLSWESAGRGRWKRGG